MCISTTQWDQECSHDNSKKQYKELQLEEQENVGGNLSGISSPNLKITGVNY